MKAMVLLVGLLGAGCGGLKGQPRVQESASAAKSYSAPSPAEAMAAGTKAADVRADRSDAPAERSAERPGLGTSWGETRRSQTYATTFERADDAPSVEFAIQYNDRLGRLDTSRELRRPFDLGSVASVEIVGEDSGMLPSFFLFGRDRGFVVGRHGERYTIHVKNESEYRFEVVASVDGLDVVNGEDASYKNRGYIVRPWGDLRIDGFRRSASAVAAFRFGSVADSYAAETGSARNVGVIGVALFRETGDEWYHDRRDRSERSNERYLRDTASPFPAERGFARPPRR